MNTKQKKNNKTLKLPQINHNKTGSSFTSETSETSISRIRPNSTSKVGQLEKNLFSQLEQYEEIGKKPLRKIKTKKEIESGNEAMGEFIVDVDVPYLKKLEKMMPQTYQKLMESKKPQPLKTSNSIKMKKKLVSEQSEKQVTNAQIPSRASQQIFGNKQKRNQFNNSVNLSDSRTKTKNTIVMQSPAKKKQRQSSFTVAEREVQSIYQRYLEEQGLTELNEITSVDLQQLNKQLNTAEMDIRDIRKGMYDIIKQFGQQVVREE